MAFTGGVNGAVVRHDQMGLGADFQAVGADIDPLGRQGVHFLQEGLGIKHHTVADDAHLAGMQDAGRDNVQDVFFAVHNDSVPCIVSALETYYKVNLAAEQIDDFALAFIAPLSPDDGNITHLPLLGRPYTTENLRRSSDRTRQVIVIRAFAKGVNLHVRTSYP